MATIGQQLTAPETGWRRYDETNALFKYTGTWTKSGSNTAFYSSYCTYTNTLNDSVSFKFYGTKFRIFDRYVNNRDSSIKITIDDVSETYSAYSTADANSTTAGFQNLVYEKTGLAQGIHTVTIQKIQSGTNYVGIDAVDMDDTGYLVAQVGVKSITPDPTWKRYDDRDNYISYKGAWTQGSYTTDVYYLGTDSYIPIGTTSNQTTHSIKFRFYGTKLRVLGYQSSTGCQTCYAVIDGVQESFTQNSTTMVQCVLSYEKTGLPLGYHNVELYGVNADTTRYGMVFDAIDVDDTGSIVPTVGSKLTAAETGWRRYDNLNSYIKYTGTWSSGTNTGYYSGAQYGTNTSGSYVTFRFRGTKFRIISSKYTDNSAAVSITVDGVADSYSQYDSSGTIKTQNILYEAIGLENKIHTIVIKNTEAKWISLDAVDVDDVGSLQAQIGMQILTTPDSGWKRYDDTNGAFQYVGTWTTATTSSDYYLSYSKYASTAGQMVKFKFTGTAIRLLSRYMSDQTASVSIKIDGIEEFFNCKVGTTALNSILAYEKLGLANTTHDVVITTTDTGYYTFDAVDIDTGCRIYHINEVTDPNYLTSVGKMIRCHYTATSGAVGAFSGLGAENSDFIPAASAAAPNGDFYLVYAGDDNNDGRILIPDRNLQHTISWDALNNAGVASRPGLVVTGLAPNLKAAVRLLTGGTIASDKQNEWDKYIVNSTLNGTIASAGNNWLWNWSGIYSYTSTTPSSSLAGTSYRVVRGNTAVGTIATDVTTTSATTNGFRPAIVFTKTYVNKCLFKTPAGDIYTYKNGAWQLLGNGTVTEDMLAEGVSDPVNITNAIIQTFPDSTFSLVIGKKAN